MDGNNFEVDGERSIGLQQIPVSPKISKTTGF
jgi:hypothetical protein